LQYDVRRIGESFETQGPTEPIHPGKVRIETTNQLLTACKRGNDALTHDEKPSKVSRVIGEQGRVTIKGVKKPGLVVLKRSFTMSPDLQHFSRPDVYTV